MTTINEANNNIKKAYYNEYFVLSTKEEPYEFFKEERLFFWADDLLNFIYFLAEIKTKIVVFIEVERYKAEGMNYLIELADAYKEEVVRLKHIEVFGK